jgi:transposase
MLGGRPGQHLAQRLLVPVSKDTLLRSIRRHGAPRVVPPTVIGIDDWAWRRNQRYGTIICDLERVRRSPLERRAARRGRRCVTGQRATG